MLAAQSRALSCFAEARAEILSAIKALSVGVVECGAGDGYWLRELRAAGIDAIGYDPNPRSDLVMLGDHRDAAKHVDRALLIVWPPDGNASQAWLDAYHGPLVLFCASPWRLAGVEVPGSLEQSFTTIGRKGRSTFGIYRQ